MKRSMFIACLVGLIVMLTAAIVWLAFHMTGHMPPFAVAVLWSAPFFAALVAARLSPAHKLLVGLAMAPVAALLATVINFGFQMMGMDVDFPGPAGGAWLFAIVLAGAVLPAAAGGLVGRLLTPQKKPRPRS